MNRYAYRVYKTLTSPVYAGTVTSNSMDNAVKQVMKECNIISVKEFWGEVEHNFFMLKDEKVSILIYANPEEL